MMWRRLTRVLVLVKQFIRNVRASKTIADERAVVQKESAAIRASFREETHNSDLRYVPISSYKDMRGNGWHG